MSGITHIIKLEGAGGQVEIPVVNTFADIATTITSPEDRDLVMVENPSGTFLLGTRKKAGIYMYDSAAAKWQYQGSRLNISDSTTTAETGWSSTKITAELAKKANAGHNHAGGINSFETISKNLAAYPVRLIKNANNVLTALSYDLGNSKSITKTLNRNTDGEIESIVLSGDVPSGIPTTKTLVRDVEGNIENLNYS